MRRTRAWWVPNALTTARLVALPVLAAVLLSSDGPTAPAGAALYGAVAVTDLVDGWLARRLRVESAYGRIVDPLADRLLVAVVLVGIIALGRVLPAGPAVLLARDAIGVLGFAWYARRGVQLRVDLGGKVSSALAMLGTGAVLVTTAAWADALFWLGVAASMASLAHYAATLPRRSTST